MSGEGETELGAGATFEAAWRDLPAAFGRSLELAYLSLAAGGLAVGAVLTDGTGAIVAEGRNRGFDPPGGAEILQGTPLAHAELNVLAAVATGRDLGDCVLWSTQDPCSMCSAAAAFTGVGMVRHLAPDPWSVVAQAGGQSREATKAVESIGQPDDRWVVAANLLFLLAVGTSAGPDSATLAGCRELEPETAQIVLGLLGHGQTAPSWTHERNLRQALESEWPMLVAAANRRSHRIAGEPVRAGSAPDG